MKENPYYIRDFSHVCDEGLFHHGKLLCENEKNGKPKSFARSCYAALKINYAKFYKMDVLCKFGILASEVIFRNCPVKKNTALVFSNSTSSLDTDEKHQQSIRNNEFPSPAVFVYTLPNIVLGEISIKYGIQSENAFFVSEKFDAALMAGYAEILLNTEKAEEVLCGWIDVYNQTYDVFLYLVSREGKIPLTNKNLNSIYHKNYE